MKERGWEQADFVYVTGDAYVDHSSFSAAVISRVLESRGYKVALLPQPDWHDERSVMEFGRPRLGFLVSAGNMDSMVNHYTANKKPRSEDLYSPGGKPGKRPDYATIVYTNLIRRAYKDVPVIIGGIEASLRRMAHYDYWSEKFRRSILLDSGADLLIYGMGELAVTEIADALDSGLDVKDISFIAGTVYKARDTEAVVDGIELPDYDEMLADKRKYAESFRIQSKNTDPFNGRPLIEKYGEKRYVIQNPPMRPLTTLELDDVYELPYENAWHPSYDQAGGIPAFAEIKFSLTSNRGCFGGCSFCALNFHQGRIIQARSHESLIREAKQMIKDSQFKGYIHDVGGPTADFRHPACEKQLEEGACPNRQCLYPKPCKNLRADHTDYIKLLRKLRALPGVKKVFIRSGIRFDYVMADADDRFLQELCAHHISGQLRVAPEHVSDHVLALMGKPSHRVYEAFAQRFARVEDRRLKKAEQSKQKKRSSDAERGPKSRQYLVPYYIGAHPGCELSDAIKLAEAIRDMGAMPDQVQDFYPTPSTVSTVMYYTGIDPRTMKPVHTVKSAVGRDMQRALMQYRKPENYDYVRKALLQAGREDLIGYGKECLIPPRPPKDSGKSDRGRSGRKRKNTNGSHSGKTVVTKLKNGTQNRKKRKGKK